MTDAEPGDETTAEPKPGLSGGDGGDGDGGHDAPAEGIAEPTVEDLRRDKEVLEQQLDDSRKAMDELRRQNETLKAPTSRSWCWT